MLNKEDLDFFNKSGFIVIKDMLTPEECAFFNSKIRAFANSDFAAIMNPDRVEFLLAQSHEKILSFETLSEKVMFIEEARVAAGYMRDIMRNPKAVKILEQIQGNEVVGLMTQMLFKENNSPYASQAWTPHQDNAYPRNINGQYITTNFFFADADKSNGSLYVYPGSHLEGIVESEHRVSYREKKGDNPGNTISDKILKKYDKVDVNFKSGDMLILHGNCIHGSYANTSRSRPRPFLSCSYITKGESFVSGKNAQRREISLH